MENKLSFQYHQSIFPKFTDIYDLILDTGLFSFVGYGRTYDNGEYLFPMGNDLSIIEKFIKAVPDHGPYYADHLRRVTDFSMALWPEKRDDHDMTLS